MWQTQNKNKLSMKSESKKIISKGEKRNEERKREEERKIERERTRDLERERERKSGIEQN